MSNLIHQPTSYPTSQPTPLVLFVPEYVVVWGAVAILFCLCGAVCCCRKGAGYKKKIYQMMDEAKVGVGAYVCLCACACVAMHYTKSSPLTTHTPRPPRPRTRRSTLVTLPSLPPITTTTLTTATKRAHCISPRLAARPSSVRVTGDTCSGAAATTPEMRCVVVLW